MTEKYDCTKDVNLHIRLVRRYLNMVMLELADEYKAALKQMGEALKHHYRNNRHHPEHFDNGVNDMTLVDVIEMVCDWNAAAFLKGQEVDLKYLSERFGISVQLAAIIGNTLRELNK